MSALPLASARHSKRCEFYIDGALCNNIGLFYFHIFFWVSNIILSDALILLVQQLQTQQ